MHQAKRTVPVSQFGEMEDDDGSMDAGFHIGIWHIPSRNTRNTGQEYRAGIRTTDYLQECHLGTQYMPNLHTRANTQYYRLAVNMGSSA